MNTNRKARVAHVKQRIADLVKDQKRDKAKCRQPHEVIRNQWGYPISCSAPLETVLDRSYDISALLNIYHLIRGKEACHTPAASGWKRYQIEGRTKALLKDVMEKYPEIETQEVLSA
jgi:hypothetical protein